jgi:N-acetylmuramoyl-L-alanine amidase
MVWISLPPSCKPIVMRKCAYLTVLFSLFVLPFSSIESDAAVPLTPIQVLIDVGHGGVDSGTSYGDLYEKDLNLQVGKRLYELLTKKGYHAILNRDRDVALSDHNRWLNTPSRHIRDLAQRKHLAKEVSPLMMISLHVNWSSDERQRGPLVIYQSNNQSYLMADIMQHALNQVFGLRKEPVKGGKYYLLKHSYCPSVIVEMGFISNARDRTYLTTPDKQQQIAQAMADAVDEYLLVAGELQAGEHSEESWIDKLWRILVNDL